MLTGAELARLADAELIEQAEKINVFARVAPEQKLRLVEALQARGHVVAMTGDGVNDAPALKQANIGVAMGITGTDVSKEAADMILTDDNFATIEAAVEEGRGVFDNLTKFIAWTLPTNLGEGLVLLAAIVTGATLPILPIQFLWINMVSAAVLGVTLSLEPKEPDLMQRKPRDPQAPILNGMLIWRIVLVSVIILAGAFGLFEYELLRGASLAEARTVAVNVVIFVEILLPVQRSFAHPLSFSVGFFLQSVGSGRSDLDGVDPAVVYLCPLYEYPVQQRTHLAGALAGCAGSRFGGVCCDRSGKVAAAPHGRKTLQDLI